MGPRDRKLLILRQLGIEFEPISLGELSEKLGLDFTARTIRRSLNQLINEGVVKKSGHTKGAKYIAVRAALHGKGLEKTSDLTIVSSCFGSESLAAIRQVSRPLFERQPVAYNSEWFHSYNPNQTFYLSNYLRQQLFTAGQRASEHDPAGTYAHQIYNRLIIDLSYNSSRLEGNTYSLLDTEKLLLHGDSAKGKLDVEKVMILNHKEAIRYLIENAIKIEVNRNVICTLHYLLSDGLLQPSESGKIRQNAARITGSTYIPFQDHHRLEQQLESIANKAALINDPFEQSIFLLIHISYLQAFADVNKRTARLSANISLVKGNLVPLAFNDIQKTDYISAMFAIYELQDIRPLVDLYVYSYLRTCASYDSTVKSIGFDEVRIRYRQQRREIIRAVILKQIPINEVAQYVEKEIADKLPKAFLEDVLEDLDQIDESRLVGLGVTLQELQRWVQKNRSSD